jgi:hypothetical protein
MRISWDCPERQSITLCRFSGCLRRGLRGRHIEVDRAAIEGSQRGFSDDIGVIKQFACSD